MSDELPRRRTLDSLRKEAKRWLAALRAPAPANAEARLRLELALPDAPADPTLRDVQHAIAREHGFIGWLALKEAIERAAAASRATKRPPRRCSMRIAPARQKPWSDTIATPGIGVHGRGCVATCSSTSAGGRARRAKISRSPSTMRDTS